MLKFIPEVIGNAKASFTAETDGIFDLVEREGKRIEIVCIAVCQYHPEEGYYLFGCDKEFNTHTDFYYEELEESLVDAKRIYQLEQINWQQRLPIMEFQDTIEVFISLIDGTQVWVPVRSKSLGNNQFLILDSYEFDCSDYSLLPEFIPGDIVLVGQRDFQNGEVKTVARSLVKPSFHPDKEFFEFMYRATINDLPVDEEGLIKYKTVINRVEAEYARGRYFYPAILEIIDQFRRTFWQ